jgi:hypothetical protein
MNDEDEFVIEVFVEGGGVGVFSYLSLTKLITNF